MNIRAVRKMANKAWDQWREFSAEVDFESLFDDTLLVRPFPPVASAVGIKLGGLPEVLQAHASLYEQGDQSHCGPVNDRTIATLLKPAPFALDALRQIKLLQRRPGSDDELGLDHLDVYLQIGDALMEQLLKAAQQRGINCEYEANDAHGWISVSHNGFEFKLVNHPVWKVCCDEAQQALTTLPAL